MDDLLPLYEAAVDRNPWTFIARYLPTDDLCAAVLVCRKWHRTFTPHLWGSPALHFNVQSDTVYVALTRFRRVLPSTRVHVRELTHTLCFPPAHAEIYGGSHAEWLRDCLEYLPQLQCVVVNALSFFDHASLWRLRYPSRICALARGTAYPVFGLRLLDAAACANATSTGLAEALPHFPDLVSLDLSGTPAARDEVVLGSLKVFRNLRVLCLKSLRLRDADVSIISRSIGTSVVSLDVSDNNLTEVSARFLLEHCMKGPIVQTHLPWNTLLSFETDLAVEVRKKLTNGFMGNLAIEGAGSHGITHLSITKNAITIKGVSSLLRSGNLQRLDVGELHEDRTSGIKSSVINDENMEQPKGSISKLTPILSRHASAKLNYLRINYKIVTEGAGMGSLPTGSVHMTELSGHSASCSLQNSEFCSSNDVDPNSFNIGNVSEPSPEISSSLLVAKGSRHDAANCTDSQKDQRGFCRSQGNQLLPSMLPQVRILVLTNVPMMTTKYEVVSGLIRYIKAAAKEASIARQRARHTYMLPPGRTRATAEKEFAHGLFALERIVLEMAPPEAAQHVASSSRYVHSTKSVTEDRDSEAFWEAGTSDFSFFDEEECEHSNVPPLQKPLLVATHGLQPPLDVVGEIRKFRKDSKAAYKHSVQMGQTDAEVEGWWPGDVTIARPASALETR